MASKKIRLTALVTYSWEPHVREIEFWQSQLTSSEQETLYFSGEIIDKDFNGISFTLHAQEIGYSYGIAVSEHEMGKTTVIIKAIWRYCDGPD